MSFDRIAPLYRWLEYLTFAGKLQRCRTTFLPLPENCAHLLVLGDGDGRFLTEALVQNPQLRVTAVDASANMIHLARKRTSFAAPRVRFLQLDLLRPISLESQQPPIDGIASHFFLDCFTESELEGLVDAVLAAAPDSRTWWISEFDEPGNAAIRGFSKILVNVLYVLFQTLTNISATRLPRYEPILQRHGFQLAKRVLHFRGILRAEEWGR